MRVLSTLFLAAALAGGLSLPAAAQDWHHGDYHGGYYGHDFDHWRGGNWYNGFHDGRNGWWWIVDGSWYFYPAPVYPYPDPYTPPTVVVEQAPVMAPGAAPAFVYYCPNPAGYYPAVPECAAGWQKVAPAPVAAPVSQRDLDYQTLNGFVDEFEHINIHAPHAYDKLRALEKRVEAFRKGLYDRDYNAMQILKNSEDLQHRIAAQRQKLAPPPAIAVPAPVPPPQ